MNFNFWKRYIKLQRKNHVGLWSAIFATLCLGCAHTKPERKLSHLISPEVQSELVKAIRNEMIRLDGEGLIPRKTRKESFITTTDKIAHEALENKDLFDFYRTFSRLNSTYTNIHAHVTFPHKLYDDITIPGPQGMAASNLMLSVEVVTQTKTRTVLQFVSDNQKLDEQWAGAELTAINGVPLSKWQEENFLF